MSEPRLQRRGPLAPAGIVHFGPGAFFRAFNAIYTQEAMAAAGGDWGIIGVGLQSPAARDQLAPQGCAYTAVTLAPTGEAREIVEAITKVLFAPEEPEAVRAALVDPATRIVSLTITEKGYLSAGLGSAIGYLVECLARRRAAGLRPFTVLSCDNLPNNGALTRRAVLAAAAHDPDLTAWIAAEARFPATMVDRITPATTAADIDRLAAAAGYRDAACVFHEPFRQWVIEDDFVDGARPAWDVGGAQFVDDVERFELMKLRCLNGAHSALAYLGYLAGHEVMSDCAGDPVFAAYCRRLWRDEVTPTLAEPPGQSLSAYCDALLTRFQNPAIRHRLWQIAMDGSQKLPQRLLGSLDDALAAGRAAPCLTLAVAAWLRYVGGVDEAGGAIDVRDPMAAALRQAAFGPPEQVVDAVLAMAEIVPPDLAAKPELRAALLAAYRGLLEKGARAMAADLAA